MQKEYGIGIIGTGHYLPETTQSNEELCVFLKDISPEWIVNKTGITKRYIADENESASSMAVNAARSAIKKAGIKNEDIGLIVACTYSHDYQFPPMSAKIQKELNAVNAQVFDLQANCAGFVTALTVSSDRMFMDPSIKYALVVGAELQTRFCDKSDFETAIFLSDGAGAAILGRVNKEKGIQKSYFHTDTSTYESVRFRGGGSSFPVMGRVPDPKVDYMEMNGLATWKQAITNLPISIRKVCEINGITTDMIDFVMFHQANLSLIEYVMKKMRIGREKTYTNIEAVGNTGAASLAIALSEAMEKGLLKNDNIVLFAAVGAGFIYGSNLWKW